MENDELIHAVRGNEKTTFSLLAWKLMGKNKNGWVESSDNTEAVAGVQTDIETERSYKDTYNRAINAEKEGDLLSALDLFKLANETKPTKINEEKIVALTQQIEKDAQFNELVKNGNEALTNGDNATAFEMYNSALEIKKDKAIEAKVKEIQKKLK